MEENSMELNIFSSVTIDEYQQQKDFEMKKESTKRNNEIEEFAKKNPYTNSWASSILYGTRVSPRKTRLHHDKEDAKRNDMDTITRNDELISNPSDESVLLQQTSQPQLYFDLHLPEHDTKTPMSQITMEGLEWMDDLYQESKLIAQESDVGDAQSYWARSIHTDVDTQRKDIPSFNVLQSYPPSPMKRCSFAVNRSDKNQRWSQSNNTNTSPLCLNDACSLNQGALASMEPTKIIRRQTMLKQWRDFVKEQRIFASEAKDKTHQETIPPEVPTRRLTTTTKDDRDSKNKGRNIKSRKGRKGMDTTARSR